MAMSKRSRYPDQLFYSAPNSAGSFDPLAPVENSIWRKYLRHWVDNLCYGEAVICFTMQEVLSGTSEDKHEWREIGRVFGDEFPTMARAKASLLCLSTEQLEEVFVWGIIPYLMTRHAPFLLDCPRRHLVVALNDMMASSCFRSAQRTTKMWVRRNRLPPTKEEAELRIDGVSATKTRDDVPSTADADVPRGSRKRRNDREAFARREIFAETRRKMDFSEYGNIRHCKMLRTEEMECRAKLARLEVDSTDLTKDVDVEQTRMHQEDLDEEGKMEQEVEYRCLEYARPCLKISPFPQESMKIFEIDQQPDSEIELLSSVVEVVESQDPAVLPS